MSSLIVEVCKILDVRPHPNADKLDLVTIKGWTCITQKGVYSPGDLVVYAPVDSVIPATLSDSLNVTSYLSKGRVKTVKLRGYYSQGLIIPINYLPPTTYLNYEEGQDVKDLLGITKYEPPVKHFSFFNTRSTVPKYSDPRFHKYTNIENIKNFPRIFTEDMSVVISEKLHGANVRIAKLDGEIIYGSHNCQLTKDDTSPFTIAGKTFDFASILQEGDIIYGELYGKGVQKMTYDLNSYSIRFFDYFSSADGRYLDWRAFKNLCDDYSLPCVPVLYEGFWSNDLLKLADGKSEIASHIKEGIVIKPFYEQWDVKLGRVILKHISEAYLVAKWEI